MPEDFLTAEQVAKMIGCKPDYVWKLARQRQIDVLVIGRRIRRFTPEAVNKFIQNHTLSAKKEDI